MKIDFSDYISLTENDIISVVPEGIHYAGGFISFLECAENYKEVYGGDGKCVGERYADDTPMNIAFYTAPITTHIHFFDQRRIKKLFSKNNARTRFCAFQRQITEFGFCTMDMS